jgi:hypothetical protein
MPQLPPKEAIGPPPPEPDPFPTLARCWQLERLPEEFFVLAAGYNTALAGSCEPWPDPMPPWQYVRPFVHLRECLQFEAEYQENETDVATVAKCGPNMRSVRGTPRVVAGQLVDIEYVELPRRDYDTWIYYRYRGRAPVYGVG